MKRLLTVVALLIAVPGFAQTAAPRVDVSGSVTPAIQQIDNSTNSSKLTEYRDLRDSVFLPGAQLSIADRVSGWFLDARGANISRDDRSILVEGGRPGVWNFKGDWFGIPHNFSNKAVTPYVQRSPGLFEAPASVPITYKILATTAADTAGVLASDALTAAYQAQYLSATPLAMQTTVGQFSASWSGSDMLSLGLAYDKRDKSGSRSTFGPIGDRPPRTLNIQLAEPVDYRTNDLTFAAEHQGGRYQVRAEYLLSDFENEIDTLKWQNIYATPSPTATFDTWDRSVSTYGVRPLPPDNRYHNISATFGTDLPMDSRLMATAAYGRLEQNEPLLPYSYNTDRLVVQALPRNSAEALVRTMSFAADYVIAPARRLNVRAFYRRHDLDNRTPASRWQYVTSDTSNLNGTVSYVNKRVSVPYEWDRENAGVEATWRLPVRSSLVFGYEREGISRAHREANTAENVLRAVWRTRAARWVNFEARYLQGTRDGGEYHNAVTREGYWYAPSEANDNNNPALTFDNHPDMRRYDVSDRLRRQAEARINLTPRDAVALSAYLRHRSDNFDSDVAPTQPLLGTGLADQFAVTPGDQLGRLEEARTRYGVDLFGQPGSRVTLNGFLSYDRGSALDRSLEFNENNKANPSAVATAELGPWTRAGSQWTVDHDDWTWSGGGGATIDAIPGRLVFIADYTLSAADVALTYSGYGVTNYDGTPFPANHQFAFSTPPTVREDLHIVNVRVEIPLKRTVLIAGYSYENYTLDDWQQGSEAPWVEPVGADTLLRDSSRSFQWGNRLFNLGTYLAPTYAAHIGFVGIRYRF
jgi:MtrB/PioB family decaheme-associated outer membrane protein